MFLKCYCKSQQIIAGVIKEKAGSKDLLSQQFSQDLINVVSEQKSLKTSQHPPDFLFIFLFSSLLASERRNSVELLAKSTFISVRHREVSFNDYDVFRRKYESTEICKKVLFRYNRLRA